jgi:hypothetical protein
MDPASEVRSSAGMDNFVQNTFRTVVLVVVMLVVLGLESQ